VIDFRKKKTVYCISKDKFQGVTVEAIDIRKEMIGCTK